MAAERRQPPIPSPYEVPTPEGAEGWEEMYPSYWLFTRDREEMDDGKIWFQMSTQAPTVIYPLDFCFGVCGIGHAIHHAQALLPIPTSTGVDGRILNGYFYGGEPHEITDPKIIGERAQIFGERMEFFVGNWDEIWKRWIQRNLEIAEELESIHWPELKLIEDWETAGFQTLLSGREYAPCGFSLLTSWNKFKNLMYERLYLHGEVLMLSFACYMHFREYCLRAFPGIGERQIAAMLAGIEQPLLEGDLRLRELAELAVKLGVQDIIKQPLEPEEVLVKLGKINAGREWLQRWEESKFWFHITTGNAMYLHHICWLDDLSIPFKFLRGYISDVEGGKSISIDREERAREAVELFEGYRNLLPSEEDRGTFTGIWKVTREIAIAIEGHAFYNDHWIISIASRKLRELGEYLHRYAFLKEPEDVRLLQGFEMEEVLNNLVTHWYTRGAPWIKPLQEKIEKRKRIIMVLEHYTPPPFLMGKKAKLPEEITDPLFVVLWGLTKERLEEIFKPSEKVQELRGWAGSPGICDGIARVVQDPINDIDKIKEGDILVTPFLSPSQVTAFAKIKGLVTDIGGIMSHPAIVAREYGIPATVGTGRATTVLKDGMKIRLDGTNGSVTILE